MLVDVKLIYGPEQRLLLEDGPTTRLQKGIYQCHHFNFELEFRDHQDYELDFPSFQESSHAADEVAM
jgi:hypothetical protein